MQELLIEKLVAGGYSLARKSDGKIVFLQEGYPGERVIAEPTKKKSDFQIMKVKKLITTSESRRSRLCRNFPQCGGCDWQDLEYSEQLRWKKEIVMEQFRRVGKINLDELDIVASPVETNYRAKMEYVAYGGRNGISLGLYRKASLTPHSCEGCVLGLRDFERIRSSIQDILRKTKIKPYNRLTGKGDLKHLILRGNDRDTMAILVTKRENLPEMEYIREEIGKRLKKVKSLVHLINSNDRIVLRGVSRNLFGEGILNQELAWKRFEIPPTAFFQNNIQITEGIIEYLRGELKLRSEDSLLDLYAGIGTFSLTLGSKLSRVVGVESNPVSIKAFKANANINDLFGIEIVESDAVEYLKNESAEFTTVVLDPPRSGVGKDLSLVSKFRPSRIAYVSCDPTTLARDVAILKESGFELVSVKAFDMFPQTWHVECVGVLQR
jgi:23S rRNA (uracil1939-C5)-methyltransferase